MENNEKIKRALVYIKNQRLSGKSDSEIRSLLTEGGMDRETVTKLMNMSEDSFSTVKINPGLSDQQMHMEYQRQINKAKGKKNILFGAVWFLVGTFVTVATLASSSGGGTYVVAYGAIIGGLVQLIAGIVQSAS